MAARSHSASRVAVATSQETNQGRSVDDRSDTRTSGRRKPLYLGVCKPGSLRSLYSEGPGRRFGSDPARQGTPPLPSVLDRNTRAPRIALDAVRQSCPSMQARSRRDSQCHITRSLNLLPAHGKVRPAREALILSPNVVARARAERIANPSLLSEWAVDYLEPCEQSERTW